MVLRVPWARELSLPPVGASLEPMIDFFEGNPGRGKTTYRNGRFFDDIFFGLGLSATREVDICWVD